MTNNTAKVKLPERLQARSDCNGTFLCSGGKPIACSLPLLEELAHRYNSHPALIEAARAAESLLATPEADRDGFWHAAIRGVLEQLRTALEKAKL